MLVYPYIPWISIEPLGGGTLSVFEIAILLVIFAPWYWVAARKMKREARL
jgi:hypothetical protein